MIGGGRSYLTISFHSKRQTAVSRSTTEAEAISLTTAVFQDAVPTGDYLDEILGQEISLTCFQDNAATIAVVRNGWSIKLRHVTKTHKIDLACLYDLCKNPLTFLGSLHYGSTSGRRAHQEPGHGKMGYGHKYVEGWSTWVTARIQWTRHKSAYVNPVPAGFLYCLIQIPNCDMICEHAAKAVCNAILAALLIEILTHAKFRKTWVTRVAQLEIGSIPVFPYKRLERTPRNWSKQCKVPCMHALYNNEPREAKCVQVSSCRWKRCDSCTVRGGSIKYSHNFLPKMSHVHSSFTYSFWLKVKQVRLCFCFVETCFFGHMLWCDVPL